MFRSQLADVIQYRPARGIRKIKVWIYSIMGNPNNEKGLKNWLKTALGEPPVLYSPSEAEHSRIRLMKFMLDQGYFNAEVDIDTSVTNGKIIETFRINPSDRYTVRNLYFPDDTSQFLGLLNSGKPSSLIISGEPYDLRRLDAERNRLVTMVKENGYYNAAAHHLFYYVDTTVRNHQVDLYLEINDMGDSDMFVPHYLGQLYVYSDYTLKESTDIPPDTIRGNNMVLIQNSPNLKIDVLERTVLQSAGDLYNETLQNRQLKLLLDLNVFKFIHLEYQKHFDNDRPILDRHLFLTQLPDQDITGEFRLNNRTGNYLGSSVAFTYSHRNTFRSSERIDLNLQLGAETQFGSSGPFINTLDWSLSAEFNFPKVISPFKMDFGLQKSFPRTHIRVNNHFQRRSGFYTINNLGVQFGYNWNFSKFFFMEWYPININYANLFQASEDFNRLLDQNQRLQNSFNNVFIIGMRYSLQSQLPVSNSNNRWFLRADIETSGNFASLTSRLLGRSESDRLLGVPYTQFFRLALDGRHYWTWRENSLIQRFVLGVGIPYGKAKVLPYSKHFFVGGANSIRAFKIRQLGPGTYQGDVSLPNDQFIDQVGDIKLEMNLEYRFGIIGFLKGALFLDAGNIWIARKTFEFDQGLFRFNSFLTELGVGTGLGLRMDFNFFVLRTDLAFPLRKPYLPADRRWVLDKIKPFDPEWRRSNLVFNLALGYPF